MDRIDGRTRVLALIGSPVGHSFSPAMYNLSFEKLGQNFVYVAYDVKEDEVGRALDAFRLFNYRGGNVTMPCKTAAARCVDRLSPAAELIGAVNTIVNDGGVLTGHNTDGEGFVNNLKSHGVSVKGKRIVIAGSGGAAVSIAAQCALDGAGSLVMLKRVNNSFARAVENAKRISSASGVRFDVCDADDAPLVAQVMESADIFANGTPLGMRPAYESESPIRDAAMLHEGLVVADVVYNPAETRLLKEAGERGCVCVGGKGMLLWQGVAAFKLFTGLDMPVDEVRERFFN